jgi:hypothetical protein
MDLHFNRSGASVFSPAVALRRSVDACAQRFIVDASQRNPTVISFFERLLADPHSAFLSLLPGLPFFPFGNDLLLSIAFYRMSVFLLPAK